MANYEKKKKMYFTPRMDIALLKEVLEKNPFENGSSAYAEITSNLKSYDSFQNAERRTMQDRTDRLLKVFRSEQLQSLRRSGTEEEYDEREKLLQEVSDLEIEWRAVNKQGAPKMKRAADQTPSVVRSKAVKLMGPAMKARLVPLKPAATISEPQPVNFVQEDLVENPAEEETAPEQALMEETSSAEDTYSAQIKKTRLTPATRWACTIQYMEKKLELEQNVKAASLDRQKEELAIRREEIEIKKKETENERVRLELMREEQQHRLRLEEDRRKEESEERRLLMDRQTKMMDTMLQWMQGHKK